MKKVQWEKVYNPNSQCGVDGYKTHTTMNMETNVRYVRYMHIKPGRFVQEKEITTTYNATQDMNIDGTSEPRPDQLPLGKSRNTWPNIVNNKRTVVFCDNRGGSLQNGEDCIIDFTAGSMIE